MVTTQGKKQKVFEETKFGLARAFAASKHKGITSNTTR